MHGKKKRAEKKKKQKPVQAQQQQQRRRLPTPGIESPGRQERKARRGGSAARGTLNRRRRPAAPRPRARARPRPAPAPGSVTQLQLPERARVPAAPPGPHPARRSPVLEGDEQPGVQDVLLRLPRVVSCERGGKRPSAAGPGRRGRGPGQGRPAAGPEHWARPGEGVRGSGPGGGGWAGKRGGTGTKLFI